ncbi:UbiA family prenyltransferase [Nonomuraea guangzhouensis]|uniref:UbiA family prenyltransferase n=1 Tax=Nonomuraea guangzhouensis TaxID=1291555 RepID=A0ABW4FZK2_9ACTN|nr:UbiA family prenyltransferase [Nonomuraea guangzhouensis]
MVTLSGVRARRWGLPFSLVRLCLSEARPVVQIIFLLRFASGSALGSGMTASVLLGAFAWECAVVFVYLLNGVTDVVEDAVNASRRPIARGALPRGFARGFAFLAGGLALLAGLAMGAEFFAAIAAFMLLGYLYSAPPYQLKRHPAGAAVVVTLGGLLTYWGGLASGDGTTGGLLTNWGDGTPGDPLLAAGVLAVAMSLWMGLVGTPTKDFSDTAGDAAAGRRSAADLFGASAVRRGVGLTAIALGGAYLYAASALAPMLVPAAAVTLAGAIVLAVLAVSPLSRGSRKAARLPYRVFMATQYGTHLVVALTL